MSEVIGIWLYRLKLFPFIQLTLNLKISIEEQIKNSPKIAYYII